MNRETAALGRVALRAAAAGARVLLSRFHDRRAIGFKGRIDLVTDADRASERAVLQVIRTAFPSHALVAEEGGVSGADDAPVRWYVDPLDGTTNYAHGVPHFCVSIAAEDARGLAAAAVHDPLRREIFTAVRGEGARLNGRRIRVSTRSKLARALLATGFPYDVWTKPERPVGHFAAAITRCQGIRRAGSAALDLCWVASGRYDGFFEVKLHPWDLAAGALMVREAGGRVTSLGADLELSSGTVLAANPRLHPQIARVLARVDRDLGLAWSRPR